MIFLKWIKDNIGFIIATIVFLLGCGLFIWSVVNYNYKESCSETLCQIVDGERICEKKEIPCP